MTAYTRWCPEHRITVWCYSPRAFDIKIRDRAFDIKIRDRAVKHFRHGRPVPRQETP